MVKRSKTFWFGCILCILHLVVSWYVILNLAWQEPDAQWQLIWIFFIPFDFPFSLLSFFANWLFPAFYFDQLNYPIGDLTGFIIPAFLHGIIGPIWYFFLPLLVKKAFLRFRITTIIVGIIFVGFATKITIWVLFFAGVSVPREKIAAADIYTISTQLETYFKANGQHPTTAQGLQALVNKPTIEPVPQAWEQLLDSIPLDSWGRKYQYRCPGVHNPKSFDLFSLGKNPNDPSDDIGNWNLDSFQ